MGNSFSEARFEELPLVGILRGFDPGQIANIVEAAAKGGLTNLEITMNSPAAAEQIACALDAAAGRMNIGAGTVTSREALHEALRAGATFIVTPAVIPAVVSGCVADGVPVIPGAFTPTEVWQAMDLGATRIKLFPADLGGPAHVKALLGPYPEARIYPTGGVTLETMPTYLAAGACGFGLGGQFFKPERIRAGDWEWVTSQVATFKEVYLANRK